MKRLFILAAAVFTLASCAKTQVVYNEEPQEIAFRQVENVMTKANTSLGYWKDGSMGVFAYKRGETILYFGNAKFAKKTSEWIGVDSEDNVKPYYWPFQGSLDFYVYAPYDNSFTCNRTNHIITKSGFENIDYGGENSYSGTADGSASFYDYNCPDLMYGSKIVTSAKTDQAVDVSLNHALALVQVKAKATTTGVVSIKSMTLKETPKSATLNVTYSGAQMTGTPEWSAHSSEKLDLSIFNSTTPTSITSTSDFIQLGNEVLVIPGQAQTSFSIEYKLANSDPNAVFTATLPLSETWEPGKKYVYNISFDLKEIKFAPVVEDWGEGDVNESSNGGVTVAQYPTPQP